MRTSKSIQRHSNGDGAPERSSERAVRFSAELRKRTAIVEAFERTGREHDRARVGRELRDEEDLLVAADKELRRQEKELERAVERADRERSSRQDIFAAVSDAVVVMNLSGGV